MGNESSPVSSGSIWLYCYSWYGLQSLKLAEIRNGVAEISGDVEAIKRELSPHADTEAFVVVLQLPDNLWYRSPDVPPERFWANFAGLLDELGKPVALATGGTLLVLTKPVMRHITLLHQDGRPVVNMKVDLSIYLYDYNHCGVHTGLPLGTFTTKLDGGIDVVSQSVPLYLDSIDYYQETGSGSAGIEYEEDFGLKTGSEENLVIRRAWAADAPSTQSDLPEQGFELKVLSAEGSPRSGVEIDETIRANKCGELTRGVGETDAAGVARFKIVPSLVAMLELRRGNEKARRLSDGELRELFSRNKLAIEW